MKFIIIYTIVVLAIFGVDMFISHLIDNRNLEINQKEWNEYSKGMSYSERLDCFTYFLTENKIKHGWKYYYIPRMIDEKERLNEIHN